MVQILLETLQSNSQPEYKKNHSVCYIQAENCVKPICYAVQTSDSWLWRYYKYLVTVYCPWTRRIQAVEVTDPYSVSLAADGERTQIADLSVSELATSLVTIPYPDSILNITLAPALTLTLPLAKIQPCRDPVPNPYPYCILNPSSLPL